MADASVIEARLLDCLAQLTRALSEHAPNANALSGALPGVDIPEAVGLLDDPSDAWTQEELQRAFLLGLINEAANVLLEGDAETADEIDAAIEAAWGTFGLQQPLLKFADELGPQALLTQLRRLDAAGVLPAPPSPFVEALSAFGTRFADYRMPSV